MALFESTPVYANTPAIVIDGRTQTQLSINGQVTDITTSTVKGNSAYNSFSKFNVETANTVNLHVPQQSQNLINVVRDQRSQIDGTLNAYKSGKIGGNVYFFNPNGVVVGEQGQINVGSLTIASPTTAYVDDLIDGAGNISDSHAQQALDGTYPISESGLIRVKGKINAIDNVQINGQSVVVNTNGSINVGPSSAINFADIVNVEGQVDALASSRTISINAQGNVVIGGTLDNSGSSDVNGGDINIAAKQDIQVISGAKIKTDGIGDNSNAGEVLVFAQNDALFEQGATISAKGGDVSGDGGAIEFSAKKVVRLEGGQFEAQASNGSAGSVLIDPDDIEIVGSDQYTNGVEYTLIANDSITIGENITISTRSVAVGDDHESDVSVANSGDIELRAEHIRLEAGSKLLAHASAGFTGGNILIRASEVDAIGAQRNASASIVATDSKLTGRNITLQAFAETSAILSLLENDPLLDAASIQTYIDGELDDPIDGIAGRYFQLNSRATASTLISGSQILADGDLSIESKAGARTGFKKTANASTVIENSTLEGQDVEVLSSSATSLVFPILGTLTKFADQSWLPDPESSLTETLDEEFFDHTQTTIVGLSESNARTVISGFSSITAFGAMNIASDAESVVKPNFNSPFLFSAAWGESKAEAFTSVLDTTTLNAANALKISANTKAESEVIAGLNSTNIPLAATFVYANTVANSRAEVGGSTKLEAESVSLSSETEMKTDVSAITKNNGGSGAGFSVAYSEVESNSYASLAGTVQAKTGDVLVHASTEVIEANAADAASLGDPKKFADKIVNFKDGIKQNVTNKLLSSLTPLSPSLSDSISNFMFPGIKDGSLNVGGAVSWTDASHTANALIADNAQILSANNINVEASISDHITNSAGAKTNSKGTSLGGSAAIGNYNSLANAYIGKSAVIDATGNVDVNAKTLIPYPWEIDWDNAEQVLDFLRGGILNMFLTSYSINSASGKSGLGLALGLNILELENSAHAYIDDGAQVQANNVSVLAENEVNVIAATGILSKKFFGTSGGKAALGGSADLITMTTNSSATIRGNASVTTVEDVSVNAKDTQRLVSVTEAGGKSDGYGIQGAVSINNITNTSLAAVDEQAIIAAKNLIIDANADLNVISVAGGVVATKGPVGIGFSVSINNVLSDVRAFLGDFDPDNQNPGYAKGSVSTQNDVSITATNTLLLGSYSVAGAIATENKAQTDTPSNASSTQSGGSSAQGASKSGSGKFGIGVSGDVSLNDLDATTLAYVDDGATIATANNVAIEANSINEIEALSGAVTISTQSYGNGIAGSYSQNTISENTQASIANANVQSSGMLRVAAQTSGTIESLAASLQSSKGKLGAAGSVAINDIDNQTLAFMRQSTSAANSLVIQALDNSIIRTIAGALSYGGKAGIGLSFAWNTISNNVFSSIEDSAVVVAGDLEIAAENDSTIESISAAIGASKGKMAAAGSLTINTIDNNTRAWNSGQLNNNGLVAGTNIDISATDSSDIFAIVGSVGASTSGAGVGAAFAWNEINNLVASEVLGNAKLNSLAGNVRLDSSSSSTVQSISAGGGLASKVGVAGSASIVQLNTEIASRVDQSSSINADGSVAVLAKDQVEVFSLAGNVALAGKAAIGVSNSTLITNNRVEAQLAGDVQANANQAATDVYTGKFDSNGDAITQSEQGVIVQAISSEDIQTIAAGGSGAGKAGIAGSATVTELNETTVASIGSNANINSNNNAANSAQNVIVLASDQSSLLGVAGALAFGGSAGIGAGADVGVIDKKTQALVSQNAEINANSNIIVEALAQQEITSVAASLGLGGSAGIAGSASVYILDVLTSALIGNNSQLFSDGNILVNAQNDNELDLIAGNAGVGGSAGVGASAAVAIIDKTTQAIVGDNVQITALANSDAIAVNDGSFSQSFVADSDDEGEISGPGTNNDGSENQALASQRVSTRNVDTQFKGLAVIASNKDDIETIAATGSIGGTGAVTLAGDVNVIDTNTLAQVGNSSIVNSDNTNANNQQQVLVAAGNDHYQMGIAGSASAGGSAGIGAAADVLVANHQTRAIVAAQSDIKTKQALSVIASSNQDLLSIAAGLAGGGTVGIAGSTSVLDLTAISQALIGDDASVDSDGNVLIIATNDTQTDIVDGSVAIGLGGAGVGGSVGVNSINKTTDALIGQNVSLDARANANTTYNALDDDKQSDRSAVKGLVLEATSSEDVFGVTASGAAGLYAGVAGAVSVLAINSDTQAGIGALSDINQNAANSQQSVNIAARNQTDIEMITGALGAGAAGLAGAVDVGSVTNNTSAFINNGAQVASQSTLGLSALSHNDISSIVVSAAGGIVGIAAGVSVYSIGNGLSQAGQEQLETDSSSDNATSYADDQASDNSIATLLSGSDSNHIQDAASRSQTARAGLEVSSQVGNQIASGTTVNVGSDVELASGDDLNLIAMQDSNVDQLAGAASAGAGALGAGISVLDIDGGASTNIGNRTSLSANENISLKANTNNESDAQSYAGSFGGAAADAALAISNDNSVSRSRLGDDIVINNAKIVTIQASERREILTKAIGVSISATAAVGASVARSLVGGGTYALIGDGLQLGQSADNTESVQSLKVLTDSEVTAKSDALAGKGGMGLAASGTVADSIINTSVESAIGDESNMKLSDDLILNAAAKTQADAQARGVNVSLIGAVGATLASAQTQTNVSALIGESASVVADNASISAQRLVLADGNTSYALGASGGLLGALNATSAESKDLSRAHALIGDNSNFELDDTFTLSSLNNTQQEAEVSGITIGGLLAAGITESEATSDTQSWAKLGDNVELSGDIDAIQVSALGFDNNFAQATSGSGGLISGSAATADTQTNSNTQAAIGENAQLASTHFTLLADHTSQFNAQVDSVSASAVGASGANSQHSVDSLVSSTIGDNTSLTTQHFDLDAINRVYKFWLGSNTRSEDANANGDTTTWNIKSGSGGVLNAPSGSSDTSVLLSTVASIGNDANIHLLMPAIDEATFFMDALNDLVLRSKAKLDSGGLIALAKTETEIDVSSSSMVSVGKRSDILADIGDIKIGSRNLVELDARASSDTYGLAGAPEGLADIDYRSSELTLIDNDAVLTADLGNISLSAGRSSDGQRSNIDAYSEVKLWNKTAIPINSTPDAHTAVTSNPILQLAADSLVQTGKDISLIADRGSISAKYSGIGKDIYREAAGSIVSGISNAFGGDDVSFDIKGGSKTVSGLSNVVVDGTALAGINRSESLTLDYQLVDIDGNDTNTPVWVDSNGDVVLADSKYRVAVLWRLATTATDGISYNVELAQSITGKIQARIDKLRDLITDYTGDVAAVAAYEAEIKFLQFKLTEVGLAGGNPYLVSDADADAYNPGSYQSPSPKEAGLREIVYKSNQLDSLDAEIDSQQDSSIELVDTTSGHQVTLAKAVVDVLAEIADATVKNNVADWNNLNAAEKDDIAKYQSDISDLKSAINNRQGLIDEQLALANPDSSIIEDKKQHNTQDRKLISEKLASIEDKLVTISKNNTSIIAAMAPPEDATPSTEFTRLYAAIKAEQQKVSAGIEDNQLSLTAITEWEKDFGFALTDLGQLAADLPNLSDVSASGPVADFVTVDPVKVSLGSIDIWADNLTGDGELKAPGNARIEITNHTPNFLILGEMEVDSYSGGEIRFNNGFVNNNEDVTEANRNLSSDNLSFDSRFLISDSNKPQIIVTSNYDPNGAGTVIQAPAPDIRLSGDIINEFGSVKVQSAAGSIYVDKNIRAASVDVKAENGDFVQSYVDGFFHSSGDPAENTPGAGIVANGSVVLSARYLNINGLVQSGIADLYIDLDQNPVLTGSASLFGVSQNDLDGYQDDYSNDESLVEWIISDQPGLVYNAKLDRLEADIAYADWDSQQDGWAERTATYAGLYKIVDDYGNIGASYDPSVDNGRYVLDGELVSGGYIQLYGQILNTAVDGAKLKVVDGFGQINVTNTSDRAIVINNLSTGRDNSGLGNGIEGVIDITDIQFVDENTGEVNAIHSVYTRVGEDIQVERTGVWNDNTFDADATQSIVIGNSRDTTYSPQEGLDYIWKTATSEKQVTDWKFTGKRFVGITISQGEPDGTPDELSSLPKTTRRLNDATMIEVNKGYKDDEYYKAGKFHDVSEDKWVKNDEWNDCNWWTLCLASDYTSLWTQTYGYTDIITNRLKADNLIDIEFSGSDTGAISILSKSNVIIDGAIDNRFGTTTITAGAGDPFSRLRGASNLVQVDQSISQGDRGVLIGNNFNFASSKSIGVAGDNPIPVLIENNGGPLNVSVSQGDLSLRQRSGDLIVGQVSALGDAALGLGKMYLSAEGSILSQDANSVIKANTLNLVSDNGSLGSLANPLNIQLGFDADYANRHQYGLDASAKGDIHIQSQASLDNSQADLLVNAVSSSNGDVSIRTPGKILDNSPFAKIDQRTFDELKGLWDSLALLEGTANNQAKQDAAISAFEKQGTQDYRDYWKLRDQQADPLDYDPNFESRLSAQQESAVRERLLNQGKSQLEADTFIQDYNAQNSARYHALHQKLYVEGDGAYGDQIPQSFNDDYRYTASNTERANLSNGASWTEKQLAISLAPGLIKQVTDTNPVLKDPNVSGNSVALIADLGIGETLQARTIDLNQNPADISDEDKVALAGAEREDFSIDDNGIATVLERKAVNVLSTGALSAHNQAGQAVDGDVFISSEANALVEQIWSSGRLRLKTNGSILQQTAGIPAFIASNLILESAEGAIGSINQAIQVQLDSRSNVAPLIARAANDIWLEQVGLDLAIDTIYSREDVTINTDGSIIDAFDDQATNILARQISLNSDSSIGSFDNELDIALAANFDDTAEDELSWLETNSAAATYIRAVDRALGLKSATAGTDLSILSEDTLEVLGTTSSGLDTRLVSAANIIVDAQVNAGNNASLLASNIVLNAQVAAQQDLELLADENIETNATVSGNDIYLDAANDIYIAADMAASNETVISAGNDLELSQQVSAGNSIDIETANEIRINGGQVSSEQVSLSAGSSILSDSSSAVDVVANKAVLEAQQNIGGQSAITISAEQQQLTAPNINVIANADSVLDIEATGINGGVAEFIQIAANASQSVNFTKLYSNIAVLSVASPVLNVIDGISSLYAEFDTPYASVRVDALPQVNDGAHDVRFYTDDTFYSLSVGQNQVSSNGFLISKEPRINAEGSVGSNANLEINQSLTSLRNQQLSSRVDELQQQYPVGPRPEIITISQDLFE
ncbi:leukotoxin LktA family filamentous adhesin [Alginatibacterium sediminis]|nr:leukotoxin LktA family filamentous adhesin [Alginatibacterium sediminis]